MYVIFTDTNPSIKYILHKLSYMFLELVLRGKFEGEIILV